ncbi:MAG TPA: TonB-dependent receptor, partial [Chryseosolibacter sp.]|nr:TonB-dependent receptor [Chryseosolibacter sp.]
IGSLTSSVRINENDSSRIADDGATDKSYFKGVYDGKIATAEAQLDLSRGRFSSLFGAGVYGEKMFFNTYFYSNAFGFPYEAVINYDTINTSANTLYAFGKAAYDLGRFNVAAGVRLSRHEMFGTYATFEFNPSYRLENGLIYASASTGYNAPSLYQLFDPTMSGNVYTNRGNEKLGAEGSISIEAGFKHEFSRGSYFTASIFRTVVDNGIEYVYLWNGSTPEDELTYEDFAGDTYLNVSRQTTQGIEIAGKMVLTQRFSLAGNFSWLHGKSVITEADIDRVKTGDNHIQLFNYGAFLDGKLEQAKLVRRPSLLGNAQLNWAPNGRWTFSAAYRLAGSRYDSWYDALAGPFGALGRTQVAQYQLFDLSSTMRINKHLAVAGKIENVFDTNYAEIQGYRTRGRSLYIKISYQL